jgi:hypothetical protein
MHSPLFHKNHERGSTGDWTGIVAVLHQKLARFCKRAWPQQIEGSDGHYSLHAGDTSSNRLVS